MSETRDMTLHYEHGESLPKAGDTVYALGVAGRYELRIHRIPATRKHPDGATLLGVWVTREVAEARQCAEMTYTVRRKEVNRCAESCLWPC
jgi:hypothetical protein